GRSPAGRGRRRLARCFAQVGALARRSAVPASLRTVTSRQGGRRRAPAARRGRPACVPGVRALIGGLDALVRPFLLARDPEDAHGLVLKALRALPTLPRRRDDPRLAVEAFGLAFPNPL